MRPHMASQIENRYIHRIDAKKSAGELRGQGIPAEKFVALFYDRIPGLKVRFSTREEDKGPEIGGRQTVDLVVSFSDGRLAFAPQVTSSIEKGVIEKKLKEIREHPFIRLNDMKPGDLAIPKVLISLDARQVKIFFGDPNPEKYPELYLKVIDDHIRSLTFNLSQTQNPLERNAVNKLIEIFKEERKKYIH